MMVKEFKTWSEQIEKLKDHGCEEFSSIENAEKILQRVNYYRLTAYFLPFRDDVTQKYDSSKVSFDKIYNIYTFDTKLRHLLLEYLEEIELYFKTQIAYCHSRDYGPLAYNYADNFNNFHKHDNFLRKLDEELEYHKKTLVYKHHVEKYENEFPLWVMIEFFTFGMVSRFYSDMPSKIQQEISKNLNLKPAQTRTYMEVVTVLRNYCAHFNRLYYSTFSVVPNQLPAFMNENIKIKNRLLPQIYALKSLYFDNEKWNDNFLPRLTDLIETYSNDIHLHHIGFTDNWSQILRK
ncbi:Abi family protein [Streptococcus uberis]|uniref:Abi family protein n=1 Tax=Streptococcus uberis TaxID=1349 RepID=UPI00378D2E16